MTAISANRTIVPFLLFLACGVALALVIQYGRRPAVDTNAATTAPAMSKSASEAREQSPAPLAKAQAETKAVVDALVGLPPAPESSDGIPTFDVARIEPTGETVIAGRATPGATVELLRDGEVHDRAVADKSGQFVIVPPKLPPGTYDLTLRPKAPDGTVSTSRQRVTAALEARSTEKPVVALVTPNKPTVVLSQPGAAKPGTGAVVVETVEIEPSGKFHVSGQARPGAALRLYLNDSFVTSVTAGADGRFAVTINEGVAPGELPRQARRGVGFRRRARPRRGAIHRAGDHRVGVGAGVKFQASGFSHLTTAAACGRGDYSAPGQRLAVLHRGGAENRDYHGYSRR